MKKHEKTSWHSEKYMVLYISFRKQIIWKICKKKAKNKFKKFLTSSWVYDILNELLNKTTMNLDN